MDLHRPGELRTVLRVGFVIGLAVFTLAVMITLYMPFFDNGTAGTVVVDAWVTLTVVGTLVGLGALIARPRWRRTAAAIGVGVLLGAALIIGTLAWFIASYHSG